MTLKTSSNTLNPAINFFKTSLKKQGGFVILSLIISLLVCPGVILKNISDNSINISKRGFYEIPGLDSFTTATFMISLAVMLLLLFVNFSFLYSKKSSDVFHSLPLTRNELLLTRFSASFIGALIPLTASFLGLLIIALLPITQGAAVLTVVKAYLLAVLQLLMCGCFMLIFIVSAGAIFDMIISLVAVNVGFPVLTLIVGNWLSSFAEGVDLPEKVVFYTSPILFCTYNMPIVSRDENYNVIGGSSSYFTDKITVFTVIALFVLAAVFGCVAISLFRRRKSETAGEAYSFRFMPILITILISMGGGLVLSAIFDGVHPDSAGYWTFFCIGAAIAAVAGGAIMTRGFKQIKASLIKSGVAIGLMAVLCLSTVFVGNSIVDFVPNENRIKYIKVRDADYSDDLILEKNFTEVLNIHQSAVNVINSTGDRGYYDEQTGDFGRALRRFEITYILKSGRKVERTYHLYRDIYNEPILKLMQSENYINAQIKECEEIEDNLLSGDYVDATDQHYGNITVTKQELIKLNELYIDDLKNADASVFQNKCTRITLRGKTDAVRFTIPESFTKTLEYVNTLNIVLEEDK